MSDVHEFDALAARLDDLIYSSEKGELAISCFLTPKDVRFAERYLRSKGVSFLLFGGYADAERQRVYILPDYMAEVTEALTLEEYGYSAEIDAVELFAGGFRKLSHRDYLGSVLGLGLERSVIGDIAVWEDGARAVVFCDAAMSGFICDNLCKVASDKVRGERSDVRGVSLPPRRTAPVTDTVASPRCDCVVAALCSLSRERARETVVAGLVEVNYECEERPDKILAAPCVVSVRGKGKFRVLSLEDKTKKGRYRLIAEKYL